MDKSIKEGIIQGIKNVAPILGSTAVILALLKGCVNAAIKPENEAIDTTEPTATYCLYSEDYEAYNKEIYDALKNGEISTGEFKNLIACNETINDSTKDNEEKLEDLKEGVKLGVLGSSTAFVGAYSIINHVRNKKVEKEEEIEMAR